MSTKTGELSRVFFRFLYDLFTYLRWYSNVYLNRDRLFLLIMQIDVVQAYHYIKTRKVAIPRPGMEFRGDIKTQFGIISKMLWWMYTGKAPYGDAKASRERLIIAICEVS